MNGTIKLGRIAGIQIGLHYSWFLIAALLTISLAAHLESVNRDWPAALVWTAATLTAVAFFGAILAHELSHAAVARARGVPVPSITLFALGGLARMDREIERPGTEFWVAIAGPIASVAIGCAALAIALAAGWAPGEDPRTATMVMLVWFGYVNVVLALFNMIPGYPLDGGRVLRSIVWRVTGNRDRATKVSAGVGQLVAVGFIVFGFLGFMRGAGFGGLWLAFIGFFLLQAAGAAAGQVEVSARLAGVRVRDLMARDCRAVSRAQPVEEVAQEILRTGQRCFFVVEEGRVLGLLTPREIRAVARERWPSTPVGEIMRPLERLHRIAPDAPVTRALEVIGREDVNQLPVFEQDRLLGILSRDQILRVLAARAELRA